MRTTTSLFRLTILGALGLACADRSAFEGEDQTEDDDETEEDDDLGSDDLGDDDGTETGGTLCEDPQPIIQADSDAPSGFVRCSDGFVHREAQVTCLNPGPVGSCTTPDVGFGCTTDADCIDAPFGRCDADDVFGGCSCDYGCESDADCADGTVCACAGVVSGVAECVLAGCATTSECDGLCGLDAWVDICNHDRAQLACLTEASTCRLDAECGSQVCDPVETIEFRCSAAKGFACQTADDVFCGDYCGEGRPFWVDGELRMARLMSRSDWQLGSTSEPTLDAGQSEALARYWTRVGLLEHASVASFARFSLQLLALGAPSELVRASQTAMGEEVEHARLAFGLASRFAGETRGPGPLSIDGAIGSLGDRLAVLGSLIVEACVGETLAAIEAQVAADRATDLQVLRVLRTIAREERQHAALGWSTLAWMLDTDDSIRAVALASLEQAIDRAEREPISTELDESATPSHGLPSARARGLVRAAAIRDVLRPCLAELTAAKSRRCA